VRKGFWVIDLKIDTAEVVLAANYFWPTLLAVVISTCFAADIPTNVNLSDSDA